MATAKELIPATLKLIGVVGVGVKPSAPLLFDTLAAMNSMLDSWSSAPQSIFFATREEFTLAASKVSYTIGSGGDLDTTRPQQVMDSYITINETDFIVKRRGRDQYDRVTTKTTEGRPSNFYYEPEFPLGVLKFYPVPDENHSFTLISLKPFSTYEINDVMTLPPGYERAIKYNLALEIADNYGKQVSLLTMRIAVGSFKMLKNVNLVRQTEVQTGLDPTGSVRGIINPNELFNR